MMNAQKSGAALIAALALVGCGDNGGGGETTPDAKVEPSTPDAKVEPQTPDAGVVAPTPNVLALNAAGTDGFFGVTADATGNYFAVGIRSATHETTSDREMIVTKFKATGEVDTSFGDKGTASKNVAVGGKNGEAARGIVIQPVSNKIIVFGAVEHDIAATGAAASDRDVALVRFNTDGKIDEDWGTKGVVTLNFADGVIFTPAPTTQQPNPVPTLAGADQAWNVVAYPDGKLLIAGSQRNQGKVPPVPPATDETDRRDNDWVVVRLNADGTLDDTFGAKVPASDKRTGKAQVDVEQASHNPRSVTILADGSIIGGGYGNVPSLKTTQPVVFKLTPNGDLDETFGNPIGDTGKRTGYFTDTVLEVSAESYGVAVQGEKLVTIGYGRNSNSPTTDWISIRLNKDGTMDKTWGKDGRLLIDGLGKGEFTDNGRGLLALPGDRVMFFGTVGTEKNAMNQNTKADAMIAVVKGNGELDTSVLPGGKAIWDLGGTADIFWTGVVSPDKKKVFAVGLRGFGNAATATGNDDAAVVTIPLP